MSVRDQRRGTLLNSRPEHSPVRGTSGLHPLVKGAAISLIVLSAVGVGVMTGLIPSPLTRGATPDTVAMADAQPDAAPAKAAPAPAPAPARAPAATSGAREEPVRVGRRFGSVPTSQIASNTCASCGVVQDVRSYKVNGQGSGVGAIGGGVIGGVVGNQFGGGSGRTALTVLGALGGAFAGNQVEKHVRSTTQYEMTVRMEDGTIRTFRSASPYNWQSGDPVRVQNGQVTSRSSTSGSDDLRAVRVSG